MPRGLRSHRDRAAALGALAFAPSDDSPAAERWRNDPDVARAWDFVSAATSGGRSTYLHPDRRIMLTPGDSNRSVALSELAFAFELGLGPISLRKSIDAGIGIRWFGVF